MIWPFMLRRTHNRALKLEMQTHNRIVEMVSQRFQAKVDAEYNRAREEGQLQVHKWAVEANWNLFHGMSPFSNMQGTQRMRATAALQDAQRQFNPTRTQLDAHEENTDAPVRS